MAKGELRVIYCEFPEQGRAFLLNIYSKKHKSNLTKDELKEIKDQSKEISRMLKGGRN